MITIIRDSHYDAIGALAYFPEDCVDGLVLHLPDWCSFEEDPEYAELYAIDKDLTYLLSRITYHKFAINVKGGHSIYCDVDYDQELIIYDGYIE
jgi:hypothetical protein